MPLTNAAANDLLELLFENTDWPNIGDAGGLRGSVTAGNWQTSLHTASPGVAGNQTTNEISYTGYGRVAVARSAAGWTVASQQATPDASIQFGQRSDVGSATATDAGIGTASSGVGNLIVFGDIDPDIIVNQNVTPILTTASAITAS